MVRCDAGIVPVGNGMKWPILEFPVSLQRCLFAPFTPLGQGPVPKDGKAWGSCQLPDGLAGWLSYLKWPKTAERVFLSAQGPWVHETT